MSARIEQAVRAMGSGPLTEEGIARHIAPLFSRVLDRGPVYLANHSLGRPLNAMEDDVREATALWYSRLGDAWDEWLAEQQAFRCRIARLIGAPRADCVVPKTSAAQGLRTVLNALGSGLRVVSTRGEFDSIDVVLKQYAALGRIAMHWIEPDDQGEFRVEPLIAAVEAGARLVVVSQVMFMSAQIVTGLDRLAATCHAHGARLLLDSYHAIGVIPVNVEELDADFVIGGSYKYLRGGPGACFLYLAPRVLEDGLRPLDAGWFAKAEEFSYQRPDPPVFKAGGDAFLEATPPVLTWYQARSGQEFALAMGVDRLRAYSLRQLRVLRGYLEAAGISPVIGADERHGAFVAIQRADATEIPAKLAGQGIICDARGDRLRLCPDCLTREEELRRAADALARIDAR